MRKESHIAKIRREYEYNRRYILRVTGLTECQYNLMVFDTGISFLESIYPRQTEYEYFYRFVAYDRDFWLWWVAEWKKREYELIKYLENCKVVAFSKNFYLRNQLDIKNDKPTENRFYEHYQKPKFSRATTPAELREPVEKQVEVG